MPTKSKKRKEKIYDCLIKILRYLFINFIYNGAVLGGARVVIVIVVGNEHGGTSSNPGRD